jgi:hypothetical protein
LERKSKGYSLESRKHGHKDDHVALSTRKMLAVNSSKNGRLSVGIVRLRAKATEFVLYTLSEEKIGGRFSVAVKVLILQTRRSRVRYTMR